MLTRADIQERTPLAHVLALPNNRVSLTNSPYTSGKASKYSHPHTYSTTSSISIAQTACLSAPMPGWQTLLHDLIKATSSKSVRLHKIGLPELPMMDFEKGFFTCTVHLQKSSSQLRRWLLPNLPAQQVARQAGERSQGQTRSFGYELGVASQKACKLGQRQPRDHNLKPYYDTISMRLCKILTRGILD